MIPRNAPTVNWNSDYSMDRLLIFDLIFIRRRSFLIIRGIWKQDQLIQPLPLLSLITFLIVPNLRNQNYETKHEWTPLQQSLCHWFTMLTVPATSNITQVSYIHARQKPNIALEWRELIESHFAFRNYCASSLLARHSHCHRQPASSSSSHIQEAMNFYVIKQNSDGDACHTPQRRHSSSKHLNNHLIFGCKWIEIDYLFRIDVNEPIGIQFSWNFCCANYVFIYIHITYCIQMSNEYSAFIH